MAHFTYNITSSRFIHIVTGVRTSTKHILFTNSCALHFGVTMNNAPVSTARQVSVSSCFQLFGVYM